MDLIYYIPIALLLLYVSVQVTVIAYNQRKNYTEDIPDDYVSVKAVKKKNKEALDHMRNAHVDIGLDNISFYITYDFNNRR